MKKCLHALFACMACLQHCRVTHMRSRCLAILSICATAFALYVEYFYGTIMIDLMTLTSPIKHQFPVFACTVFRLWSIKLSHLAWQGKAFAIHKEHWPFTSFRWLSLCFNLCLHRLQASTKQALTLCGWGATAPQSLPGHTGWQKAAATLATRAGTGTAFLDLIRSSV